MTIVIGGAGMAGVATAFQLAVRRREADVVLIDSREPLTLTSDKGTQGYRNWWPGPDDTMLRFVSRSIDLLEEMAAESNNVFRLSRRGYLFATADAGGVDRLRDAARVVAGYGMGDLREHTATGSYQPAPAEGYLGQSTGADLLVGDEARRAFPYLTERTTAALHVRRAGWMNAVALGDWMLRRALAAGARFVQDRVIGVDTRGGRVRGVTLASGTTIACDRYVIAAGPEVQEAARLLDLELPVFHELHAKVTMRDPHRVMSRAAPFAIWIDPVELPWTDEERTAHASRHETRRLLAPFPAGVHARPVDGPHGDELFLIWTFDDEPTEYRWPPTFDPWYAEICLRGLASMMPGMRAYFGTPHGGRTDGGYYCKTRENRPLVGPLAVPGAFVIAALGGAGIMSSHAAAELVAAHVTGDTLPEYARWFTPARYDDPAYRDAITRWGDVGQL